MMMCSFCDLIFVATMTPQNRLPEHPSWNLIDALTIDSSRSYYCHPLISSLGLTTVLHDVDYVYCLPMLTNGAVFLQHVDYHPMPTMDDAFLRDADFA